jgi:hypothetical protein
VSNAKLSKRVDIAVPDVHKLDLESMVSFGLLTYEIKLPGAFTVGS